MPRCSLMNMTRALSAHANNLSHINRTREGQWLLLMWLLLKEPFVFNLHSVCRILERRHSLVPPLQVKMIGAGEWIRHNGSEFVSLCLLPREVYTCKSRSSDDPTDSLQPLFHLEDVHVIIGSFGKRPRRQQRERHKTKGFRSRAMALHVRFESLFISLSSSAK